jgi:hypothetical protein
MMLSRLMMLTCAGKGLAQVSINNRELEKAKGKLQDRQHLFGERSKA